MAGKGARASHRVIRVAYAVAALLVASGCGHDEDLRDRLDVYVSIIPQRYFVERIGGDHVRAHVLVGPGQSPTTYEPTPRQMAALGRSALYIRIGVPFETTLTSKIRQILPELEIVDGTAGIELEPMITRVDRHDEEGKGHGHHPTGGPDPHIWLDPLRMKVHAEIICEALCRHDPRSEDDYRHNLEDLTVDLDRVHARLSERLAHLRGRTMYVFHPAYGYLAGRYGLVQKAVVSEGKEPGVHGISALIDHARSAGTSTIFVQPQFSSRTAEVLAEALGGEVVALDPLAPDYIANLERMAESIASAFGP